MKSFKKNIKIIIGLLISALFMYLALSKVDYHRMMEAFKQANYWYVLPGIAIMFVSYWLRSFRWRYLMEPIAPVKTGLLFNSLLVGYMANSFLPAHLGEVIRAYIVGKKKDISSSMVFGTIITERIIDILSLILLMGITIIVFPFPDWVQNSGYILLAGAVLLSVVLVLMKVYKKACLKIVSKLIGILPQGLQTKIIDTMDSLLDGIVPLKNKSHYLMVFLLTALIWVCYAGSFQVVFYCFDFVGKYSLPWTAPLVLLVITTISVVVPSSPGYVGTYHFLCMSSLALFIDFKSMPDIAAKAAEADTLSYAFIMHGINFFPIIIVGLIVLSFMKVSLKDFYQEKVAKEKE